MTSLARLSIQDHLSDARYIPEPVKAVSQADKLQAVIDAALHAQRAASSNDLFVSPAGYALINAMHDLTECDDLYRLAEDISWQLGDEE
jgi:hypothetical protein